MSHSRRASSDSSEYAMSEVDLLVARNSLQIMIHIARGISNEAFTEGIKSKMALLSMLEEADRTASRKQKVLLRHLISTDEQTGERK